MKRKKLIYRRFCSPLCIILLGSVLSTGMMEDFVSAEVTQAYRRPSEADLQWLFDGQPQPRRKPSENPPPVVQTAFTRLNSEPRKRVGLPMPPIPPAPNVLENRPPQGILPLEENRVLQMSGDRLPPPAEVPKEPPALLVHPPELTYEKLTADRLPVPIPKLTRREQTVPVQHFSVPEDEELTCQPRGGIRETFAGFRKWIGLF